MGRERKKYPSLQNRVALLLGAVLIGAILTGAVAAYYSFRTYTTIRSQRPTSIAADHTVNQLFASMLDEETGERGYIITGRPAFLQPYYQGRASAPLEISQLRTELRSSPALERDLSRLTASYHSWLTRVAEPGVAAVQSGNSAPAIRAEISGYAKSEFDTVRANEGVLSAAIQKNFLLASRTIDSQTRASFIFVVVRLILVIVAVGILWFLLRHFVILPVQRLAQDVRDVAQGDFDKSISTAGSAELASLGEDIEAMRRRLRDEADELRQLRQALSQRSPLHQLVKTQLESSVDAPFPLASRVIPAEGVLAGDWFDVWETGEGRVVLALIDVSGHGPEAGLLALQVKHLLAAPLRMGMEPGEALDWLSDQLGDLGEMCLTGIVIHLDVTRGVCRYANAGHPEAILISGGDKHLLTRTGPIVCGLGGNWFTKEVPAAPGDRLVVVTDGVLEARLPSGDDYGLERLTRFLEGMSETSTPEDVAEALISEIRHTTMQPLRDDATVVVVELLSSGGDPPEIDEVE